MPGFDRRGPAGMGPMTGWGRGRCAQYGARRGHEAFGPGFGSGGRGGRGRGWRHWGGGSPGWGRGSFRGPFYEPSYPREDEMSVLKEEAAWLREELNSIEQRLSELETRKHDG